MSSGAFGKTLVLETGRSRALTALVALAYVLACTGVAVALPAAVAVPAVAGGGLALAAEWRRLGRVQRLHWSGDGYWRLSDPEGPAHRLVNTTWSTPWLILLVLRGPGGTIRQPIVRDTLDRCTWRRLRARLRVEGPSAAGAVA